MVEALTETRVAAAVRAGVPAGKSQVVLWSNALAGFGLKIRASGASSWVLVYRPKGAHRGTPSQTLTLGQWPGLSLKAAETAAKTRIGEIALSRDPAAELRAERNRERQTLTAALDGFEKSLKARRIVNIQTQMSTLRRGLAPLANKEVGTLTRTEIVERIEALENAGKPGAAADLRKHSRSFLEWSVSKGLAPFNVMAGLRRPRASRAERLEDERKGRALTDSEIGAVWAAAGSMGSFGGLVRLALLTGLRRSELAGLRWPDVRGDRIVVAAHRAKTGLAHEVPITSAMRAVLSAQPKTTSALVFPSSRGSVPLSGWSKLVPNIVKQSGVRFSLHDLRRTTRTLMSRLGTPEDTAELAIGHVRQGLVATYNLDTSWPARADAFELVSEHIAKIVGGNGAIPLYPQAARNNS